MYNLNLILSGKLPSSFENTRINSGFRPMASAMNLLTIVRITGKLKGAFEDENRGKSYRTR